MQNSTGSRIPPRASNLSRLNKAIDISKKVIDATDCTRFSMLITVKHGTKEYNEVLIAGTEGIEIPKELIHKFFEQLGQDLIAKRIAIENPGL